MKSVAIVALALGLMANAAEAGTIVGFTGNENDSLATTVAASSLVAGGNSITSMLANGAPFDVSTGYGFHIEPGNFFSEYAGTLDAIALPAGVNVDSPGDLGDVLQSSSTQIDSTSTQLDSSSTQPGFRSTQLDFGSATDANPNFAGGSSNENLDKLPPLLSTQTFLSIVDGSFPGLTEQQIASALVVQQAGGNPELGDVGSLADVETQIPLTHAPEPASMILLGSGLLYLARRKYYVSNI